MPRIDNDVKLDFKDVLLRPKRSTLKSRSEVEAIRRVDLKRSFTFRNSKQTYDGIPVVAANMDTVGTFQMAKALAKSGLFTCIHKHYSIEAWTEFANNNPGILEHVAVSSGIGENDFKKLCDIIEAVPGLRYICLDVANGYSELFVEFLKQAGNVVTGEMVEELILAGADIIKVGIGPGESWSPFTQVSVEENEAFEIKVIWNMIKYMAIKKAGVGYPQLSAVIECADAAHGLGGHIVSDGGCTCPGDVVKAFGAGADFVMLGGMFSGHDESDGEIIHRNGKKMKLFYGMSSATAMNKHSGGVAEYRASEGKTVEVPYKGEVIDTVLDILGGLRSACTYVGAGKLKELSRRTTFIRVTQQTNNIFGSTT
ncbi:GMP reductase 1 [Holothuria leucospilota]|uniref:GMP reductase n=1 Tax=Holothuria leucospilota TaxID=206669 RepID=A0A9Q1HD99_HOLLE|nr:GMP reductase 1 [Holothuria leucospilota]